MRPGLLSSSRETLVPLGLLFLCPARYSSFASVILLCSLVNLAYLQPSRQFFLVIPSRILRSFGVVLASWSIC